MEGPGEKKRKEPDTGYMREEGEGEGMGEKKIRVVGPGMEARVYTAHDFFSKIPREVQMVILTNFGISYYDIARLCAVARMSQKHIEGEPADRLTSAALFFLELCESPLFWRQKLQRDFPETFARMDRRASPILYNEWKDKYKESFDKAEHLLFASVNSGDLANVQRILALGVDPNKVDDYGVDPNPNAKRLERSVSFTDDNPKYGWTALHYAVNGLHLETAEVLVNAGANVNARDSRMRTPLMTLVSDFRFRRTDADRTAKNRKVEAIAFMLIQNGALVNATDKSEDTALIMDSRVASASPILVQILVDGGANVNHQGKFNKTALMLAAANNRLAWVDLLLDLGADPNLQDVAGKTALRSVVARHERSSRVTLLRAMGRKKDMTNMVRLLLIGGADPNVNSETKSTVLGEAAASGDADMVRILLEAGAEVDETDQFGTTPLMIAAQLLEKREASAVAQVLIDHRADPSIEDKQGQTAAMLAEEAGNKAVFYVIEDAELPSTQPYTSESSPRGYRRRGKRGKKKYRSGERATRPF